MQQLPTGNREKAIVIRVKHIRVFLIASAVGLVGYFLISGTVQSIRKEAREEALKEVQRLESERVSEENRQSEIRRLTQVKYDLEARLTIEQQRLQRINDWQFLRTEETKQSQLREQYEVIAKVEQALEETNKSLISL